MTNKYLEKVAEILEQHEKMAGDKMRGYLSGAWMENSIAKKHGKEGPTGFKANAGSHLKSYARTAVRGLAEGAVGQAVGAGVGKVVSMASKGRIHPGISNLVGQQVGSTAGGIHGVVKSLKNQESEMHAKYSK